MTRTQIDHHCEQVEALRVDFNRRWPVFWKCRQAADPRVNELTVHHLAWVSWLEAFEVINKRAGTGYTARDFHI